jgi:hypothetical protein
MVNQAEHIASHSATTRPTSASTARVDQPDDADRAQAGQRVPRRAARHGERFHYFDTGIKRLIIELELDDVCVFLVHLSLKYRHRQEQLRSLHDLIIGSTSP